MSRTLALLFLLGTALGCTLRAGEVVRPENATARDGALSDRFRLVITDSSRDPPQDGKIRAGFEARIEMADGTPVPEGRWYFEAPRMGEDVLLHGDRRLPAGEWIGPTPGFSTTVLFGINDLLPEVDEIRRMAIDIPALEIVEGDFQTLRIDRDSEVTLQIGGTYVSFSGDDSSVSVVLSGEDEEIPSESFFDDDMRPTEHAWSLKDSQGRTLVFAGGGEFP